MTDLFPQELLKDLGILDWGYTEEAVPRSLERYDHWVDAGLSEPLTYLSDHRKTLREDLKLVYPEFQSAVVFLFSYQAPKKWMLDHQQYKAAGYAFGFGGEDYHHHLKKRLQTLASSLQSSHAGLECFISLDAQPILERDLAFRAGLGWFGKNSMIIHQKEGSYFLIGSLLLNQTLNVETKKTDLDHCGQCVACIEACPTQAIDPVNRTIIANKCISTFTIEIMKDAEPPAGFENSRGEIFGCDICQDVCPWNKKVMQKVTGYFQLKEGLGFLKDWLMSPDLGELQEELNKNSNRGFRKKLFGTPFDRPGKEGWLKNLKAMTKFTSRNDS